VDALSRGIDEVINEARRSVREGVGAGCDAAEVVAGRAQFWSILALDEGRSLRVEHHHGPLPVRVPAADLAAAVDALLGNVFAHTPEGTGMVVDVRPRAGGGATVTVADGGPGIPEGAVERGRSGAGSTGLGLDIARRTAEASGGALRADSSPAGTRITLELGGRA
jgi:signal transduction histidine kinase